MFKIIKLLTVATFSVHLFACMFFRVKVASAATVDDVVEFYTLRDIEKDVSSPCSFLSVESVFFLDCNRLQDLMNQYVSELFVWCHLLIFILAVEPLSGRGSKCSAGLLLLRSYNVYNCWVW